MQQQPVRRLAGVGSRCEEDLQSMDKVTVALLIVCLEGFDQRPEGTQVRRTGEPFEQRL